jgi:hypothetical protein
MPLHVSPTVRAARTAENVLNNGVGRVEFGRVTLYAHDLVEGSAAEGLDLGVVCPPALLRIVYQGTVLPGAVNLC